MKEREREKCSCVFFKKLEISWHFQPKILYKGSVGGNQRCRTIADCSRPVFYKSASWRKAVWVLTCKHSRCEHTRSSQLNTKTGQRVVTPTSGTRKTPGESEDCAVTLSSPSSGKEWREEGGEVGKGDNSRGKHNHCWIRSHNIFKRAKRLLIQIHFLFPRVHYLLLWRTAANSCKQAFYLFVLVFFICAVIYPRVQLYSLNISLLILVIFYDHLSA